ncbi:acyl carrier protein [Streptomyces similanensis]|uniref:Carrier domain-containing protein n=1 Tax=Streptomyces similanensis TaxID=1274988 RepID=A0ABP9LIA1_9ACTN
MSKVTDNLPDVDALGRAAAALVAEHLGLPEGEVRSARCLFDLPGFDSLAVIAVLEGLEERAGREVPAERIMPEAFESITSIAELFLPDRPAGPDVRQEDTV